MKTAPNSQAVTGLAGIRRPFYPVDCGSSQLMFAQLNEDLPKPSTGISARRQSSEMHAQKDVRVLADTGSVDYKTIRKLNHSASRFERVPARDVQSTSEAGFTMTTIYRRVSVTTTITIGVSFLAAGLAEQIDLSCLDRNHECQLTYLPVNATQPDQQHTPDDGENGSNFPTLNNDLSASGVNLNAQVVSSTSEVDLILPSSPATFDYDQYIASRLRQSGINLTISLYSSSESATATSVNLRNVSGVDGWSEVT